jgi:hypothetical protein
MPRHCTLRLTCSTATMPIKSLGIDLLYVSTSFLWWQAVVGIIGVKSSNSLRMNWRSTGRHMESLRNVHNTVICCTLSPSYPLRQHQGRRLRLTPRGFTVQAPPSDGGQPWGRIREEQRHHRCIVPRDAMPTRRSSFRLLGMASPHWLLVGSYCYDSTLEEQVEGHTVGLRCNASNRSRTAP